MKKDRVPIPRVGKNEVLKEYNHLCARCGGIRPHIHHIDKNPSNDDPMNLIPLCPNCHFTDQHDPTKQIDIGILQLFRQYKDPTILLPQFYPLYIRMRPLGDVDDSLGIDELHKKVDELADFIAALEMGGFYSKQVKELLGGPGRGVVSSYVTNDDLGERAGQMELRSRCDEEYREKLRAAYPRMVALLMELLHYQNWQRQAPKAT